MKLLTSTAVNANTTTTPAPKLFSLPSVHAVILTTRPPLSFCAWLRDFMSVPCVFGTKTHFDPLTPGRSAPIPVWLASNAPTALVHVGKGTLSGSTFCTLLHPTEMTCPERHFSVPSNLPTSHTTYNLAAMRPLPALEVSKYVMSLDPCNSVAIGLPAWSDRISDVGAAYVAVSLAMARTDANDRNPLMMRRRRR
ncbi:hypothetical protein OG21DRAFT_1505577 [Imleria badia]|nr:hypothetical protein OG21DRAFT_1505577 [Imleria badia]